MLKIYTAQYRYPGPDRLDITVKGKDEFGRIFAPTWGMVNSVKGVEAEELEAAKDKYVKDYYKMMAASWFTNRPSWLKLVERTEQITFVCFCPAGDFCHRHMLADIFKQMWKDHIELMGERLSW